VCRSKGDALAADFTTTDVHIDDDTYGLKIKGFLASLGGNEGLLVPSASSWGITDGVDTINVPNATSYDTAAMINTTFTIWGGLTEDAFFTRDASLVNGGARIAITPLPAGVLLGLAGLSMVGVRMRKYA